MRFQLFTKALVMLGVSLNLSCTLIPCKHTSDLNSVQVESIEDFIVGEYYFFEAPIAIWEKEGPTSSGNLIINKNGSFKLNDVPKKLFDIINSDLRGSKEIVDLDGIWETSYYQGSHSLKLRIKSNEIDERYPKFTLEWPIYERKNHPVIIASIGDPDECWAIVFEKN